MREKNFSSLTTGYCITDDYKWINLCMDFYKLLGKKTHPFNTAGSRKSLKWVILMCISIYYDHDIQMIADRFRTDLLIVIRFSHLLGKYCERVINICSTHSLSRRATRFILHNSVIYS